MRIHRGVRSIFLGLTVGLAVLLVVPAAGFAQDNVCDEPGDEPDVIVGDLHQKTRWGSVGGITAFSIGTVSCNVGTCGLNWISSTNEHPVIGQNMYRERNGRFEQIGQSWLKHGFFALSQTLCSTDCIATSGTQLGVNCSDPYSANLNGNQSGLGPKDQVNATSGVFPYPARDINNTGNAIYKRLQVHDADLDPSLNSGARYYVEGQYVTADDSAAGNSGNNVSYRRVIVVGAGGNFDIEFAGPTVVGKPAVSAWAGSDSSVFFSSHGAGGRFNVASKATDLGTGMWRYEYAIHNLNSNRSGGGFRVPVAGATVVTNIGFHDVDYHSGEIWDGTDWPGSVDSGEVVWRTDSFATDPQANAIRWGTLYNFRFDADLPPQVGQAALEIFLPGTPSEIGVNAYVPTPLGCNGNGVCDPGEAVCECPEDCSAPLVETACQNGVDDDCDGQIDCADIDCDDMDGDNDGFGTCTDCNDGDDTIHPDAIEFCDGVDNDCDSGTADGADETWFGLACDGPDADQCDEGVVVCQSLEQVCSDTSGNNLECPDGVDNDCDGQIDEGGVCGDGVVDPGDQCDDGNAVTGDGCAADCTTEYVAPNGIDNGDFETGTQQRWSFANNGTGSLGIVDNAAVISLPTVGKNVQLLQRDVALEPGTLYRLSFDAGCQNDGSACSPGRPDVAVALIKDTPPYNNYGLSGTVELNPCLSTHVIDFVSGGNIGQVSDGRLRFFFSNHAADGNVYTFDNIYLQQLCAPGNPEVCDGIDNDCSAATADGSDEAWMDQACDGADSDLCDEGVLQCSGGVQSCSDVTADEPELCDGVDNDCNAATEDGIDEAWLGLACDGADSDQCLEGALGCLAGVQTCEEKAVDDLEVCDGVDNDCNAGVDDDADGDGFDACADCDNNAPSIFPAAVELNDGRDNQCPGDPGHGEVDEIQGSSGFFNPDNANEYSWPPQPGATSYEVVRSPDPRFATGCSTTVVEGRSMIDPELPASDTVFHYLCRALTPNPGGWSHDDVCP